MGRAWVGLLAVLLGSCTLLFEETSDDWCPLASCKPDSDEGLTRAGDNGVNTELVILDLAGEQTGLRETQLKGQDVAALVVTDFTLTTGATR